MKILIYLIAVALPITGSFAQAISKNTADYLRLAPETHVGTTVSLDVSMVKPVHWKSPVDGVVFFHALTADTREDSSGGSILVAVTAGEVEKFAKKYGMTFDGRNDVDKLTGDFLLVSGKGPSGFWLIDTTGKLAQLIKENKLKMPDSAKDRDHAGERDHAGKDHDRRRDRDHKGPKGR